MTRYKVLTANNTSDLADQVEKYMSIGWVPTGGVSYWAHSFREYYRQAMCK